MQFNATRLNRGLCLAQDYFPRPWIYGFIAFILSALSSIAADNPILLNDVTKETGIDFVHTDGSSGRRYIVESVSSGLALFDYDRDGDVDIYFLNGAPLPGAISDVVPQNALYRNDGDWKFSDVTQPTNLGDTGYGLGVCTGDYNNDGLPDLFVNNFGPNALYKNNGDGTFTNVAQEAGVEGGNHVGSGACFLDMDRDGDLDLFVGRYVDFTFDTHKTSTMNGFPSYVGPLNYPSISNLLYRNDGDGTFMDVSESSGIASRLGSGMGAICADYDNDGDTDIMVGNDLAANFLFQNDGTGKFKDVGFATGVAYDMLGVVHGTMAVECADWNNDGLLDFYTTSYQRQLTTLYQNMRGTHFEDITRRTSAGEGTYPQVTWGAGFVDLDNDSDKDLFVACGHLIDNVDKFDDTTSYKARNIVLQNGGNGRFANVSENSGGGLQVKLSSRGAAFGDLDNDGDQDVVVINSRSQPTILRNESKQDQHWIQILLRGTKTNRDGIGARVTVTGGGLTQIDEVHSGRSYQSDFGKRLHFGLKQQETIEQIRVDWIGGGSDVFRNIDVDQRITIVEGSSPAEAASSEKP
jgi:hypothetical protein